MAKIISRPIPVPASVASGAAVLIDDVVDMGVFLKGTFVGTVQFQISDDAVVWHDEGAALTAPGNLRITTPCKHVRADTTAYTSGTPTAAVCGDFSNG